MNDMHQANREYWNSIAQQWQALRDQDELWQLCPQQPELAFEGEALEMIHTFSGPLAGKQALVIGAGDHYAAFALAGLGAQVTASDISEQQLEIARRRADRLGLAITFVQADAAVLDGIADDQFDLVVSTNGFYVWIAEPLRVFQQAARVLKPGGFYIFYDIHPFQRPWKDQPTPLEMAKPYDATGPFHDDGAGQSNYQFTWRMSDLLNGLAGAGLVLCRLGESPARDPRFWEGYSYVPGVDRSLQDWRSNPRAGLPVWLSVAAQKR